MQVKLKYETLNWLLDDWDFSAIVKRDTISDIKDSLGDALGISDDKSLMEELEDLDIDVGYTKEIFGSAKV